MAHFKSVVVKYLERLFKGSPYRPVSPLPVLFFEFLRSRQLFFVRLIFWSSHPEFQLCSAGYEDLVYFIGAVCALYILEHIRMFSQQFHQVFLKFIYRPSENRSGSHLRSLVMDEKGWYPQCSHGKRKLPGNIVKVIIYIPVDALVGDHIHLGIV